MRHAAILHQIRTLAARPTSEHTDAELVQRFAADRDEACFAALVQRHGPMVRSVCRNILRHEQDAEDAFQATFFVLARKAESMQQTPALGGWLFGVAHRIAMNVRSRTARRRERDRRAAARSPAGPMAEASLHELQALLDTEVARLPEKYRSPFILCCLEGHTKAEAARQLGWKEGTVSSRLAQARERLRDRLARRGVTLSAALTALALGSESAAGVPAALAKTLARGAVALESVPANVAAAARVCLTPGFGLRLTIAVIFMAGLLAGGVGLAVALQPADEIMPAAIGPDMVDPGPTRDLHGDPLPKGAIARLGTMRFRHGRGATLAFAPDGKTIITFGGDRTFRIWDVATGHLVQERTIPNGDQARNAVLSPDGKLLAFQEFPTDDVYYLWDLERNALRHQLPVAKSWIPRAAFSPDSQSLVIAHETGDIQAWDVMSGTSRVPGKMRREALSLSFNRDQTLAALSWAPILHLFDL
jgi:RNA polymerase sigma factor (sigma-70 family)